MRNQQHEKLTYTIEEAGILLGIGRNSAYKGVKAGEIPSITIGGRKLVPKAALDAKLAGKA